MGSENNPNSGEYYSQDDRSTGNQFQLGEKDI